jgi:alpha-ribazole phosphatase
MRLLLIRHGEPVEEARGRCYGRLDVALSPTGSGRAKDLARELAGTELAAVYTSPRRRARETADELCHGRGIAPVRDDRLSELNFGSLEGRTYAEIERDEPVLFRRWMQTPALVRFPDGESFDDLRARVSSALGELRRRHDGSAIAVVTHGGVVRAALAEALALPPERLFALDVGYGSLAVIDWLGATPIVRLVNGRGTELPSVALGR